METYKKEYNCLLKRYKNGCDFLEKNPKDFDKYIKILLDILDKLNEILKKHNIKDEDIILNGFKR